MGEEDGRLALDRLAVGDHILLGGDNVDLALAHGVHEKLKAQGTRLDSWQFAALTHACRSAKENGSTALTIPGRGSGLVGGTVRAELTAAELRRTVDAFFPDVEIGAAPAAQRRAGLTALGLPYAQDPAVTRHLAAFLRRSTGAVAGKGPTSSIPSPSSGSALRTASLRERLAAWSTVDPRRGRRGDPGAPLLWLDLAVALGASYPARPPGPRVRICGRRAPLRRRGAPPPSVSRPRACRLPGASAWEGSTVDLPQRVGAVIGDTARSASSPQHLPRDAPGAVVEEVDELLSRRHRDRCPAGAGRRGAPSISARVTGWARWSCSPSAGRPRWKLEFS